MISLVVLGVAICCFFSVVFWSVKNGIVPMPSWSKQTQVILSLIPLETTGAVYELGSGWGTLAARLARQFPEARIIGIENSPVPYLFSRLLGYAMRLPNLQFRWKNFFDQPLENATGIVCYLYPGAMVKLKPKLERELRNGAWVVSNTFAVPGWTPSKRIVVQDIHRTNVYNYTMTRNLSSG